MGLMVGDKPTICGGWNWLGNPPTGYDVCYSLDTATGAWEQFETLPEIRYNYYATIKRRVKNHECFSTSVFLSLFIREDYSLAHSYTLQET